LSRIVRTGGVPHNPADERKEDAPDSKTRFQKKISPYEEFLVREELEIKRRTMEQEYQDEINQPKFRKPIARKIITPEKKPLAPPVRAPKQPAEQRLSPSRAAPATGTAGVEKKQVPAIRAIDLARGVPAKKKKDADSS
jgi:hypothetical protein